MYKKTTATSVVSFLEEVEPTLRKELLSLCQFIANHFPEGTSKIAYDMPAFLVKGKPLCYFNVYPNHVGFYVFPQTHKAFEKALSPYKRGKGSVQFPLNKPLPLDLIKKMIQHRAELLIE
jgi:uncharacterized protein YdhG (YjbR/CyaY superfamily)